MPERYRQATFKEMHGWAEFVVPPHATRYIWVSDPGSLTLHSMDNRTPGLTFDVKIEAGLGLDEEI
jgi:hypothetical protein